MYIEIAGIEFANKGSELMLHAVIQKAGQKIPDAKFVVAPRTRANAPYEKRARLGLYQKIWFSYFNIPFGMYLGRFVPENIKNAYGLVAHEDMKIVFDASGFAYSDQWGEGKTAIAAKAYKKWKKLGVKIIMLPQAMGPFTSSKIRRDFKTMVDNAEMVLPRDSISYSYVTDLVGKRENVLQYPDFTCLVEGVLPDEQSSKHRKMTVCIIPNYRMIDKKPEDDGKKYIGFLVTCIKYLLKKEIKPFILLHEGEKDILLAEKIIHLCEQDIQIVKETDPLKVKGIIGSCSAVIGSRYHGLVSSLSQGIPALAAGWSHKYEMLFSEYRFMEGYLTTDSPEQQIENSINKITGSIHVEGLRKKLTQSAEIQKQKTEEMWGRVFECLGY